MRKHLFSIFLCLCYMLASCPSYALANVSAVPEIPQVSAEETKALFANHSGGNDASTEFAIEHIDLSDELLQIGGVPSAPSSNSATLFSYEGMQKAKTAIFNG